MNYVIDIDGTICKEEGKVVGAFPFEDRRCRASCNGHVAEVDIGVAQVGEFEAEIESVVRACAVADLAPDFFNAEVVGSGADIGDGILAGVLGGVEWLVENVAVDGGEGADAIDAEVVHFDLKGGIVN